MKEEEIWKDIPGYEGLYRVSNLGRVESLERITICKDGDKRRIKRKILSGYIRPLGYVQVRLTKQRREKLVFVHRLVMSAFVGELPEGMEVCHNDGNSGNNVLSNLRYDTRSGNMKDAVKHKTHISYFKGRNGVDVGHSKLNDQIVLDIRRSNESISELARKYGVARKTISDARLGVNWKHVCG